MTEKKIVCILIGKGVRIESKVDERIRRDNVIGKVNKKQGKGGGGGG